MAMSCLANVSQEKFWAITAECPDLICRLLVQIRMMGWLGIPWVLNTGGALCFVCKSDIETDFETDFETDDIEIDLDHFRFNCPALRQILRCLGLV